jgi:glutathione S-transferase
MPAISLSDPVFATYALAACLMILKVVAMSWLTVWRMMQVRGGFAAPEDLRRTPLNPVPDARQILPDERVERIRRIQRNDLENIPFFLAAGFLFVLAAPGLTEARLVLYGYVVSRLLHFGAYLTAQIHDIRAAFWTVGSVLILWMVLRVMLALAG